MSGVTNIAILIIVLSTTIRSIRPIRVRSYRPLEQGRAAGCLKFLRGKPPEEAS